MNIFTYIPILIAAVSLWLSYRAFITSKNAEELASRYNALSVMSEWSSNVKRISWEYLFTSRRIELMLEEFPLHKELLMWKDKTDKYQRLPTSTLAYIQSLISDYDKSKKVQISSKKMASQCTRGKILAQDALNELEYINKALDEFNHEKPIFYRGN